LGLVGIGLFAVTWGAVRAPSAGWGTAEVIGAFAVGAAFVGAFVGWEQRARHPMVPLGYFRLRGFSSANGVVFFLFASLFGALFLIAQLLQTALGYSPLEAGLRILPWTGMPMLVAPVAGALADRFGNRPFMAGGVVLQAVGLGWVATIVEPGVGYSTLAAPLIVAGVGISMCFPTVANEVVSSVPVNDAGVAAGTNSAIREIGGVLGIAVVAAVFANQGGYASAEDFVDGFGPALWVAAALAAAGVVAAVLAPPRRRPTGLGTAAQQPQPKLAAAVSAAATD
jgi:MFS family permease